MNRTSFPGESTRATCPGRYRIDGRQRPLSKAAPGGSLAPAEQAPPFEPETSGTGTCEDQALTLDSSRFSGTFVASQGSYGQERQSDDLDFQTLVDLHYGPLFRFAMSLTRTETDAADLVQDTFMSWSQKGHQLRDRSKVKAWLFTTLHRRFLESQRRITRFPQVELDEANEELPQVEPEAVNRLDAGLVLNLLGQVDPQYQAAVALFYLEDHSYNEIAAVLEVPLGTVKSRIARGLSQLKQLVLKEASKPADRGASHL
jgi:RNA polymerase sigma factor (sigma-70 family)